MKNFAKKHTSNKGDVLGGIFALIFFVALALGAVGAFVSSIVGAGLPIVLAQLAEVLVEWPAALIYGVIGNIIPVGTILMTILYGAIALYSFVGIFFAFRAMAVRGNALAIYIGCFAAVALVAALVTSIINGAHMLTAAAIALLLVLIIKKK